MEESPTEYVCSDEGVKEPLLHLVRRNRTYKTKLAFYAILAALSITLLYIIDDLFLQGNHGHPVRYIVSTAWLGTLLILVKARVFSSYLYIPVLVTAMFGFFFTLGTKNADNLYLLILYCLPSLTFQLAGFKRGLIFLLVFTGLMAVHSVLGYPEFFIFYLYGTDWLSCVISLLSFFLICLISGFSVLHQERYVNDLVEHISIDPGTKLPNSQVLSYELQHGKAERLYVLRFENYQDIKMALGSRNPVDIMPDFSRQLLKHAERHSLRLYRLRGNDFCLVSCSGVNSIQEFNQEAAKIIHFSENIKIKAASYSFRAFVRICAMQTDGRDASSILEEANAAFRYARKNNQRLVFCTSTDDQNRTDETGRLFSVLAENIEKGTFKAVFQPVVCSGANKPCFYELLLRIREEDGSYVSPLPYLDIAESTGFDDFISSFILCEAEKMIEETGMPVSINIGSNQLRNSEFLDKVEALMNRDPAKRGKLVLELLERQDPSHIEGIQSFIQRAKALSCKIAIDDFGSGYANFLNLFYMHIDIVKLDGRLVSVVMEDERIRGLIEGLIRYCGHMGSEIVAEWVDSPELASFMEALGVDYMQGYHFGKPEEKIVQLA